jgi:hypothetical protein
VHSCHFHSRIQSFQSVAARHNYLRFMLSRPSDVGIARRSKPHAQLIATFIATGIMTQLSAFPKELLRRSSLIDEGAQRLSTAGSFWSSSSASPTPSLPLFAGGARADDRLDRQVIGAQPSPGRKAGLSNYAASARRTARPASAGSWVSESCAYSARNDPSRPAAACQRRGLACVPVVRYPSPRRRWEGNAAPFPEIHPL